MQLAQVPDRGEPDGQGEINFPYVFDVIQKEGYTGYMGLEYIPRGQWRSLEHHAFNLISFSVHDIHRTHCLCDD